MSIACSSHMDDATGVHLVMNDADVIPCIAAHVDDPTAVYVSPCQSAQLYAGSNCFFFLLFYWV